MDTNTQFGTNANGLKLEQVQALTQLMVLVQGLMKMNFVLVFCFFWIGLWMSCVCVCSLLRFRLCKDNRLTFVFVCHFFCFFFLYT